MLFERMLVPDDVEKRDQDMKSRAQGAAVFAEPLDHVGALLRYHDSGFGDDYDNTKAKTMTTTIPPMAVSILILLRPNVDGQSLDPFDSTSLSPRQRLFADIMGAP